MQLQQVILNLIANAIDLLDMAEAANCSVIYEELLRAAVQRLAHHRHRAGLEALNARWRAGSTTRSL